MSEILTEIKYLFDNYQLLLSEELSVFTLSVLVVIGLIGTLLLHYSLAFRLRRLRKDFEQRVGGMRGKLEKIEAELNSANSKLSRVKAIDTGKIDEIKTIVSQLKGARLADSDPQAQSVEEQVSAVILETEEPQAVSSEKTAAAKADVAAAEPSAPKTEQPQATPELKDQIQKSRSSILGRIKGLFAGNNSKDELFEQLEEILISADIGVKTSLKLIEEAREEFSASKDLNEEQLLKFISQNMSERLTDQKKVSSIDPTAHEKKPYVVLMIGVNGAGKTTTTAKLARQWQELGLKVTLAAADTFRAAAVEQLKEWGARLDVPVITGADQAKPATVVFDALAAAKENQSDVLIIDTAGRLHNKANLMQELEGIANVVQKQLNRRPDETILVVDGGTGQNALQQAREFHSVTKLTGVIVTKLDGTSKGGIVLAIKAELEVPIRYIGVGEQSSDLRTFDAHEFAQALLN